MLTRNQLLSLSFNLSRTWLYKAACPVAIRSHQEVMFSVKTLGIIFHRDSLNGEYLNMFIGRNVRSKKKLPLLENPLKLFTERMYISMSKCKDLQKFTNKPDFFDLLPYEYNKDEQKDFE